MVDLAAVVIVKRISSRNNVFIGLHLLVSMDLNFSDREPANGDERKTYRNERNGFTSSE